MRASTALICASKSWTASMSFLSALAATTAGVRARSDHRAVWWAFSALEEAVVPRPLLKPVGDSFPARHEVPTC